MSESLSQLEYQALKAFLEFYFMNYVTTSLPAELTPLGRLQFLEKKSRRAAQKGLLMAVGDVIEGLSFSPKERILEIEKDLKENKLMSLADLRLRFDKRISKLIKRGSIRNESEYYLASSILGGCDLFDDRATILQKMILEFESRGEK